MTIAPSIYVGIKYFDGKVIDQPYESGLTYDADKKFISDNGLGLTILKQDKNGDSVEMQFSFDKKTDINLEETSFYIARPATEQGKIQINAEKNRGWSVRLCFQPRYIWTLYSESSHHRQR